MCLLSPAHTHCVKHLAHPLGMFPLPLLARRWRGVLGVSPGGMCELCPGLLDGLVSPGKSVITFFARLLQPQVDDNSPHTYHAEIVDQADPCGHIHNMPPHGT